MPRVGTARVHPAWAGLAPVRADRVDPRQRQRRELARLILNGRAVLGHGRDLRRSSLCQVGPERRPSGGPGPAGRELRGIGAPRHRTEGDQRSLTIGGKRGLGLGQAGGGILAERLTERTDDPARVAVPDRQVADQIVGTARGSDLQPGLKIARGNAAQHRVDEASRTRARHVPGQVHRRGDRGVRSHAGRQQLMSAQPQPRSLQMARIAS